MLESIIPITSIQSDGTTPGKIIVEKKRLFVATQEDYVQILTLQMEGSKIITGTDFINGQRLQSEEYFK
jgi:methionyl-tRNA formyltransferase